MTGGRDITCRGWCWLIAGCAVMAAATVCLLVALAKGSL